MTFHSCLHYKSNNETIHQSHSVLFVNSWTNTIDLCAISDKSTHIHFDTIASTPTTLHVSFLNRLWALMCGNFTDIKFIFSMESIIRLLLVPSKGVIKATAENVPHLQSMHEYTGQKNIFDQI